MTEPKRTTLATGETMVMHLHDLDLQGPSGAIWGLDSSQLNANLVTVRAGETMPNHVNDEVDVLILVVSGSGNVTIADNAIDIAADSLVLIPRGASRRINATSALVYLTVHTRRDRLAIRPAG